MIYNDLTLRELLGHANFTTDSDSESILQACRQHGPAAVTELDGMFAFVLATSDKLIAARDPIGIKPLYVGRRNCTYSFASEIKALSPYTDEVHEFPPGHVFDSSRGMSRYYTMPDITDDIHDGQEAIRAIQLTLTESIEKRLRSDVPLGVFLSGGLDSSIIAAIASQYCPGLKTFAVGLENSPDLKAARRVADFLGTDHHEQILSPQQIQQDLPQILYHLESFDQDLVRSAVPCYYVSQLAAQHVKVVLTGEGADELFAGYDYHKQYTNPSALHTELRRSVLCMHNINLQRVDRMTMAHGLEARVPFLDRTMLDIAFRIPVALKLPAQSRIEKWILRKAFEHLLPSDIVWRDKSQFDQGSGVADLLGHIEFLNSQPVDRDTRGNSSRSAEEAAYRALLSKQFDNPQSMLKLVTHWDDTARIEDRSAVSGVIGNDLHAESKQCCKTPNDDFSTLYNLVSARPYFRRMKELDYQIPASANLVYHWCIEEIRRLRGVRKLTVLDLCAGYGINGALMKSDLSLEQLYAQLAEKRADVSHNPFFDYLSLATQNVDEDLRIVGLDVAENALAYGLGAGFMDDVFAIDLEKEPMSLQVETAIGDCSLIAITGGFSFVGVNTFEKILASFDKAGASKPWIAGFPLLHTDLSDLLSLLDSHGYVVEQLQQNRLRLPQRRFANPNEQLRENEALSDAGLAPSDNSYFESHLLLAQPPDMPALPDHVLYKQTTLCMAG